MLKTLSKFKKYPPLPSFHVLQGALSEPCFAFPAFSRLQLIFRDNLGLVFKMLDPSCPGGEEVCFHSDLTACLSKQMFQGSKQVSESETFSVVSDFLDPMDYTVHGILQVRTLEWVAFSFSRGSFWPRDRTRVSCIAGGFFTNWTIREPQKQPKSSLISRETRSQKSDAAGQFLLSQPSQ